MTKDAGEDQKPPKTEGILRGGNDDGTNDGSKGLSIKTGSFTHNNPHFSIKQTRLTELLTVPLLLFSVSNTLSLYYSILDYLLILEPKFSP
jgi:hypothetical protein